MPAGMECYGLIRRVARLWGAQQLDRFDGVREGAVAGRDRCVLRGNREALRGFTEEEFGV